MSMGVDYGLVISIHALREESDGSPQIGLFAADISIHALREESDPDYPRPHSG